MNQKSAFLLFGLDAPYKTGNPGDFEREMSIPSSATHIEEIPTRAHKYTQTKI